MELMTLPRTRDGGELGIIDEMFEPFFDFTFPRFTYAGVAPLDLYEEDGKYVLELSAPGYDPKEINVEVSGNAVTVTGSHTEKTEKKGVRYHRREMRHGAFSRTVTLPQDLDANAVDAKVDKGILKVSLTPVKPLTPKKIEVKTA
jgi:HSP20 family protein